MHLLPSVLEICIKLMNYRERPEIILHFAYLFVFPQDAFNHFPAVRNILETYPSDLHCHPLAHKYRTRSITEDAMGAKPASPLPHGHSLLVSRGGYFSHAMF